METEKKTEERKEIEKDNTDMQKAFEAMGTLA